MKMICSNRNADGSSSGRKEVVSGNLGGQQGGAATETVNTLLEFFKHVRPLKGSLL